MTTIDTAAAGTVGGESLTGAYEIDPSNTRIGFAARYAMVTTVHGGFSQFDGRVLLDGQDPARSQISLRISTESLNTGQAQRDEHLRSADFLDVETYPELLFHSTGVTVAGPDHYLMHGELTVCRATRPVTVEFRLTGTSTDPAGQRLVGFEGAASISRADFGLVWNEVLETGGVLVGDDVALHFDVTLVKADDADPRPADAAEPTAPASPAGRSRWRRWRGARARRTPSR